MVNRVSGMTLLTIATLFGSVVSTSAQDTGSIYGSVFDRAGTALPGSTVTLTGFGATHYQVTDSNGGFRFLGLDPGSWDVKAELDGFSTVEQPNVVVSINRNTEIELAVSKAIEEAITVTAESPLLDERQISVGTTISQVELEKIPTARDPWAVMTQSPGVLTDRVNVGGDQSGEQQSFIGAGTSQFQNSFYLDGAEITDRTAGGGSSPTYFDFDQLAELQLQTGGSDVTRDVPGVTINLVTKRGSNAFRGSARFLLTDPEGYFGALKQGNAELDPDNLGPDQSPEEFAALRVDRIQEYGFEAGGPLWRDRLWAWASWGFNDLNHILPNGTNERTVLENVAIKLNAQFSPANSAVASFNNGDKRRDGGGASPNRAPDSLFNQRGPTGITKIEDTHVFGSNFFVSGQFVYVDGGFSFASTGGCGPDGQEWTVGADGILHGLTCGSVSRPSSELKLDATWFATTGLVNHEIKFGGRFREVEQTEDFAYPGRDILNYHGSLFGSQVQNPDNAAMFGLPPSRATDIHLLYAHRAGAVPSTVHYRGGWVQDTITWSRWTVNAGIRYDTSDGANTAGVVDASPAFPQVMPDIEFGGNDADGVRWTAIQPRFGVTYALGAERSTLLRGSVGRFADPMSMQLTTRRSPLSPQFATILFVDELEGRTGIYDELESFEVVGGFFGFDPSNPTALENSNLNDPNLSTPLTDELILEVEHAFLPEFVVGLRYTHRQGRDTLDSRELFRDDSTDATRTAGRADYVPGQPITFNFPGESESFEYTPLFVAENLESTGGTLLTNGIRETTFDALTLTATKRLSNRWMLRGYFQWGKPTWDIPSSYFDDNDPNTLRPVNTFSEGLASDASVDGAIKVEQAGDPGIATWMQATWSWNLNGLYQIAPEKAWGFNVAANIYGREGFPIVYYIDIPGFVDGIGREISSNEVAFGALDAFRNDDIFIADLRLEKEFAATSNTSLTFSIDGFNVFNNKAVTGRDPQNLANSRAGWVSQTLGPRIWRLGVRVSWR